MFFKRLTKDKQPPAPVVAKSDDAAPAAAPRTATAEANAAAAVPALLSRTEAQSLSAADLRKTVDPDALGFKTTADLEPAQGLIGQDRAFKAIDFGLSMKAHGFNIFVLGPAASGKSTAVRAHVSKVAADSPQPDDWVYVNRFDDPRRPRALALPAGRARAFSEGVNAALRELLATLPSAFASEDHRARRRAIDEALRGSQDDAMAVIHAKAAQQNIAVLRTPLGFGMAPMHDGRVVKSEVFNQLPETMRRDVETRIAALETELGALLARGPQAEKDHRRQVAALNEETARRPIEEALDALSADFSDLPEVAGFLAGLEADLVANCEQFASDFAPSRTTTALQKSVFARYLVTVVADAGADGPGAPVCDLPMLPTVASLAGHLDAAAMARHPDAPALAIRPGALHRANGGALLIDARDVIGAPDVWATLKAAIKASEIRLAPCASDTAGAPASSGLLPDAIPLAVKVVLFGDAELFHQLEQSDPDFARLFKVQADFDETIARSKESDRDYARLIARMVEMHGLKPANAAGVARLIEEASRLAEHRERLTLEVGRVADVVQEADYWASEAGRKTITGDDIRRALDQRTRRADRVRTHAHDAIERGVVLVDTSGSKTGQINGLSLAQKSGFSFARPVRITARVHLGQGRVTDIEREATLGGPMHSKGVMILWGYLAGRFAEDAPLALAATLVFEQSYDAVDGDSASAAELFALLSALADAPLRQDLAVTGSVNQWGEIQAVGGVNEKIEGFFDVCAARGLSGSQGVLIPEANRQHLMLREDVVAAVREGRFNVSTIKTVDEGIALMTGLEAGQKGADGFGAATVNGRVAARLRAFAERSRAFAAGRDRADAAASGGASA